MHRVIVIMAGGAGQRFWPLSREHHPKQLLPLADPHRSLLAQAVDRGAALVGLERVYIVTGRHLVEPIIEAGTGVPADQVLGEPCKRNTAGCLVYAAAVILNRLGLPPEAVTVGVLTADQRIQDAEAFQGTLAAAFEAAERHAALVTIGIQPSRPETGYGYIETGTNAQPVAGAAGRFPVYPVLRFHEKPDAATARRYVTQGGFYWNSGMFFWALKVFLDELQHANPLYARAIHDLAAALGRGDGAGADAIFARLPDRSIDYALMEGARRVLVALGRFAWDDLGSWDALERSLPVDGRGNVLGGDPVAIDAQNSVVINGPGSQRMAVAVLGVRDLVVVVSEDGVLVVPKSQAQRVKEVVEELRRRGATQV
jgi:mannose-1-phosphate guanylyltransferase